ncbi:hypothetical protein VDS31_23345, partial [Xanthomonas campestris pv. campestris]|nr:hypothetical protein [Xanthomonas campestris pv. campestris]
PRWSRKLSKPRWSQSHIARCAVADSRSVAWMISPARVQGGPRIYVLTIVVNGNAVEQSYFASRAAAAGARDAAMEFYRG